MIDLSKASLYIQAWFLSMLVEHDQHIDFIESALHDFFDVLPGRFVPITNAKDFAFLFETPDRIFLPVSGTKNGRAWADNARIIPVRGFHAGFRDSLRSDCRSTG